MVGCGMGTGGGLGFRRRGFRQLPGIVGEDGIRQQGMGRREVWLNPKWSRRGVMRDEQLVSVERSNGGRGTNPSRFGHRRRPGDGATAAPARTLRPLSDDTRLCRVEFIVIPTINWRRRALSRGGLGGDGICEVMRDTMAPLEALTGPSLATPRSLRPAETGSAIWPILRGWRRPLTGSTCSKGATGKEREERRAG